MTSAEPVEEAVAALVAEVGTRAEIGTASRSSLAGGAWRGIGVSTASRRSQMLGRRPIPGAAGAAGSSSSAWCAMRWKAGISSSISSSDISRRRKIPRNRLIRPGLRSAAARGSSSHLRIDAQFGLANGTLLGSLVGAIGLPVAVAIMPG